MKSNRGSCATMNRRGVELRLSTACCVRWQGAVGTGACRAKRSQQAATWRPPALTAPRRARSALLLLPLRGSRSAHSPLLVWLRFWSSDGCALTPRRNQKAAPPPMDCR